MLQGDVCIAESARKKLSTYGGEYGTAIVVGY